MTSLLRPTPDGFLRAGEPHLLISGALHYFRVHPDQWRDRLRAPSGVRMRQQTTSRSSKRTSSGGPTGRRLIG